MNEQLAAMRRGFESELLTTMSNLEERMRANEMASRQDYHRKFQQELEAGFRKTRQEAEALVRRSQAEKDREVAAIEARWTNKFKVTVKSRSSPYG